MDNFFPCQLSALQEAYNLYLSNEGHDVVTQKLESIIQEVKLTNGDFFVIEAISDIIEHLDAQSDEVQKSKIEHLLELGFKSQDICAIMGISKPVFFRTLTYYGLSMQRTYSNISDTDLESVIRDILRSFPNTGYKRMMGFLLNRGIRVTEYRVREFMRFVDPQGVLLRLSLNRAVVRRKYFITYADELWHVDTNLKLIRWGIVIRGGVDGKSRTCLYLECDNNNYASGNLNAFRKAVDLYGIPLRCRSDKGKENVLIAKFMVENRGCNRNSHICGRSVHNQRIERFWRDLGYGCITSVKNELHKLENDKLLLMDNATHVFVIQIVLTVILNQRLKIFRESWNQHKLRTEGNKTPLQLREIYRLPREYDMRLSLYDDIDDIPFSTIAEGNLDSNFEEFCSPDPPVLNLNIIEVELLKTYVLCRAKSSIYDTYVLTLEKVLAML